MANHLRRQIREGVASTVTGLATTGARVFQSRVYPLQTVELPGLLIYTRNETSTVIGVNPGRQIERVLQLIVEGVAKATSDLDDQLDQIAKEVETVLAAVPTALLALVKDIYLRTTEIAIEPGEKPTGRIRMTYQLDYYNVESAPDVAT